MRLRKIELISADSPLFLREGGSVYLQPDAPITDPAFPILAAFMDEMGPKDINYILGCLAERGTIQVPFYQICQTPDPFLFMEFLRGIPAPSQATLISGRETTSMESLGHLSVPGRGRTREGPYHYLSVPPFEGGCAYVELSKWDHRLKSDARVFEGMVKFETPRHEEVLKLILAGSLREYTHSALEEYVRCSGQSTSSSNPPPR